MDSNDDLNAEGHRHNVATENSDTIAVQKKKARRVSFAETTAIRFFSRDEESGTPSMGSARIRDDSPGEFDSGRHIEFGGEDGGDENDEDEEMDMPRTFLRPIGSPSPGGSTFGSASSNDEDNFFGPVSANFIRPGQLSDSAASDDDNHDLTMDSTAFSMHYRSLARSESGIDLKTQTEGQLFFEEKTPTSANIGSSMIFTLRKKTIPSTPVRELSGSHNSNDMSLVGENISKYDYEKLSPGLDALLAESRKDLLHVSVSDNIITSPSPKPKESQMLPSVDHGDNHINPSNYLSEETEWTDSLDVLNEGGYAARTEVGGSNGSASSPNKKMSSLLSAAASNRDNDKPSKSLYQLSKNGSETPLASASSPVERQRITPSRGALSKQWELVSPSSQPGSILRNGSLEHKDTETSIKKSISKLELLERSAFSSAYSAKVDTSFVKTLEFFKSPNFDSRHMSRIDCLDDSVTEDKLHSIHQSKEKNYASNMDFARPETPNHISGENRVKESLGKSPHESRAGNTSRDQANYKGTVSSPSNFTGSGKKLMHNLFTTKHSNEDALMAEAESSLAETDSVDGAKAILTPDFVSSPDIRLGKELSASPGPPATETIHIFLQNQLKQSSDSKDRNLFPERNFVNSNLSNATASRTFEVNSPKNLIEIQASGNCEVDIYQGNEIFESTDNLSSSALTNEKSSQIMDSEDLGVGKVAIREDNIPERDPRSDFYCSGSPSASCGDINESRLQKNPVKSKASPSKKEHDNEQSSGIPSPRTTHLSGRKEKFSASKRKVELMLRDTQHRVAITLMHRSPKLRKGGNYVPEAMLYSDQGGTTLTVHERKKWTDSYSKFSKDIKNLFSESADKLNSKMIDAMEDALVHQQRSKVYEMLRNGVMTQNSIVLHDSHLEKMAETSSLLQRVVFEKAKLQLKHLKKEILLKRLQLLSSRIQESQNLRKTIALQPSKRCTTNVVSDQIMSFDLVKGHEVSHEKLNTMKQALNTVDRKILNLTRTFHKCCEIKAESTCVDTVALVNEHLRKRASCRLTRLKMQMWLVQSISSENGQHSVILNYRDLIIQSINILVGLAPSVSTSYRLNEDNILKKFPNMDSFEAFAFVFNDEIARKYHGAKTLRQETQVTSSLLGTLLDVVDEVQLAQTEFQNLSQSSFSSPSVDRLDLMLCFFNFITGRKVTVALDMSCLKRGIYPSAVAPIQLASNSSSLQLIVDEINEAVKDVKTGYMRILRLCKCVSQVVRASTV